MMKTRKLIVGVCFLMNCVFVQASDIYSPVFYGNIVVSNWPGITNTAISLTSGGTLTNETYTNTYRLYMTNIYGRTPRSTNLTVTFTGDVTYTNAVKLTWGRYYKYATHVVIEKSWDAGVSWTNWLALAGTNISFIDYGTNTWEAGTNSTAAIPAGVYPWSGTSDVSQVRTDLTGVSNQVDINTTNALLLTGVRAMQSNLNMNTFSITNIGTGSLSFADGVYIVSSNVVMWKTFGTGKVELATFISSTNGIWIAITNNLANQAGTNALFQGLIDINIGDITTNAGNISTNTTDIAVNAGNISTNTTSITTEVARAQAAEAVNTGNITTNSTRITDLENAPGVTNRIMVFDGTFYTITNNPTTTGWVLKFDPDTSNAWFAADNDSGGGGGTTNQIMAYDGTLYTITNNPSSADDVLVFYPATTTAQFVAQSGGGGAPTNTVWDRPFGPFDFIKEGSTSSNALVKLDNDTDLIFTSGTNIALFYSMATSQTNQQTAYRHGYYYIPYGCNAITNMQYWIKLGNTNDEMVVTLYDLTGNYTVSTGTVTTADTETAVNIAASGTFLTNNLECKIIGLRAEYKVTGTTNGLKALIRFQE